MRALRRLSGGANMHTWSFDYHRGSSVREFVLRQRPDGLVNASSPLSSLPLATEATLLALARRAGIAAPTVVAQTRDDAELGECLLMTRISGEALPQRLLRDARYVGARRRLAFECGEALGRLHGIAAEEFPPELRDLDWVDDLERLQALCDSFGNPSPCHQLALNWLKRQAAPRGRRVLCHGDFRLGNLLINETGLTAVLDWELAHVGYAGEDLGYLCANVWRFGGDKPVAGVGDYADLLAGYRSVQGEVVTPHELLFWQLYAALGWGLVCLTMLELHRSGADAGIERAAVGRRVSESDIDILLLLEELDA